MTLTSLICEESGCEELKYQYFSKNGNRLKQVIKKCGITGQQPRHMKKCPKDKL